SFTFTYYRGSTTSGTPLPGAPSDAGTYTVVAHFSSSDPKYSNGSAQTTFTITPLILTANGVPSFAAPLGTPFSRTVATSPTVDPMGTPGSYGAVIPWGDGTPRAGVVADKGGGLFSVSGSHTSLSPGTNPVTVKIKHKLGDTTSAAANDTATVSS